MEQPTAQPMTKNPADHRYFPRWEVDSRVLFQTENDPEFHEAHTKDISCAGAALCTQYPLTQHQKIKITLFLPNGTPVNLHGEVLWASTRENQEQLLGISFFNTAPEAQQLILQQAFEIDRKQLVSNWFKGWSSN